eukprot:8869114-Heterocapsa_arctica.AAC.1
MTSPPTLKSTPPERKRLGKWILQSPARSGKGKASRTDTHLPYNTCCLFADTVTWHCVAPLCLALH